MWKVHWAPSTIGHMSVCLRLQRGMTFAGSRSNNATTTTRHQNLCVHVYVCLGYSRLHIIVVLTNCAPTSTPYTDDTHTPPPSQPHAHTPHTHSQRDSPQTILFLLFVLSAVQITRTTCLACPFHKLRIFTRLVELQREHPVRDKGRSLAAQRDRNTSKRVYAGIVYTPSGL